MLTNYRTWVNGKAMFIKHLLFSETLKDINKEISVHLNDKQVECFTFNVIQHYPTLSNIIQHYPRTENNDSDKDVLYRAPKRTKIPSAIFVILSAIFVILSAIFVILSAIFVILSAIFVILSAIFVILYAIFIYATLFLI